MIDPAPQYMRQVPPRSAVQIRRFHLFQVHLGVAQSSTFTLGHLLWKISAYLFEPWVARFTKWHNQKGLLVRSCLFGPAASSQSHKFPLLPTELRKDAKIMFFSPISEKNVFIFIISLEFSPK